MPKSRPTSPKSPAAELSVQAQTTFEFLGDTSRYLYIPAYQRPFAWKKGDISRFFNDVVDGIHEMTSGAHEDASAFLGALILVNDVTREQIHPVVKAQVPAGVHIVIDGQQRCTTIAAWACALLTAIGETRAALEKELEKEDDDDALNAWSDLLQLIDSFHTQLASMIRNKKTESKKDQQYVFYPKLIRSHEDQWSVKAREAKYVSPIGRLLWSMSCWLLTDRQKKFKYKLDAIEFDDFVVQEVQGAERIAHKDVFDAFKKLLDWCRVYATDPDPECAPDLIRLLNSKQIQMIALGAELDESIVQILKLRGSEDCRRVIGHELLRLALLASYLMNRVCLTVVTTERDDRAFDMFDALNTTGQPLTAFETFKPIVIEKVGLDRYRDSEEFKLIQEIDSLFAEGDKIKLTERFVIHAALLERGKKESKRLAKQRDWLKTHFTKLEQSKEQVKTLRNLASLARIEMAFSSQSDRFLPEMRPDARLAFEILRATKHDITLPLLSRFQNCYDVANTEEDRRRAADDFGKACKIVVAFATLWRLAHGGTAQIDDKFRLLMQGGKLSTSAPGDKQDLFVGPYCNFPEQGESLLLDISRLGKEIRSILQHAKDGALTDESVWTAKTCGRASYEEEERFVRFFVAAAMHDSIPSATAGLLERGNSGTNDMLGIHAKWFVDDYSIEHVAPQNGRAWPRDIYEPDENLKHCLGNLTLLRPDINSALRDRDWRTKRAAFSLMVEQTPKTQVQRYEQFTSEFKIDSFPKLQQIAVEERFHPHLVAASRVEIWTADFIRERSANLCKLGHEQLMRWIDAP